MENALRKPVRTRVNQDHRRSSRIIALIDCEIAFNGAVQKAVIVNLSMNGALISAKLLPPDGSTISVHVGPPHLKQLLKLEAHVLSGSWVSQTNERAGRFRVRFSSTPPELLHLYYTLSKK